jgi:uncharacterized membrane protein YgcG
MRFSRSRRIALLLPFGWLVRLLSRQDVTTTMYAASNGGGRLGPAAAILGLCLSGVGAGAACVMTGALPAPPIIAHITEEPKRAEKPKKKTIAVAENRGRVRAEPISAPRQYTPPTPTPTATPKPRKPAAKVTPRPKASTTPRAKAAAAPKQEFGFEGAGSASSSASSGSSTGSGRVARAASVGGGGGSGGGGSTGSAPKGPTGKEFGFEGG